ncbi:hypothetical protein IHV12_19950 [Fictibacillus sp. 7GRE50]|uniref:hypothetical protein n=1 Tax=Fictibacillus sp. 7GRE50 TaxID=2745878 RepID=UPI0018CFD3C5|nr:hypothetical protein [Fictibacillus sp. 7GRE50]MBH0167201.1 hypothetical protein [Fictibacillus sp. 7GRE50]
MVSKHVRFSDEVESDYGIVYLNKKMAEYNLNMNQTIERIFSEHELFQKMLNNHDELLVEKIYERFKRDLDVIRVRTGYADKNARIGLELWNGYILTNNQENYVTTELVETKALQQAREKVEGDIAAYRQKKLEREKKGESVSDPT